MLPINIHNAEDCQRIVKYLKENPVYLMDNHGEYAVVSVSDKTGIRNIAKFLLDTGYTIISTGGTFRAIQDLGERIIQVSDFTGFPEVLDGRVKTLHPKVHAGILAREDQLSELEKLQIPQISVVIANLYPFQQVLQVTSDEARLLEEIDIGGHTLIRAAAKNYSSTLVIVDPNDYNQVVEHLEQVDLRRYAAKAFAHIAEYDSTIASYFGDSGSARISCSANSSQSEEFGNASMRTYTPVLELKYGCNPYQKNAAVCSVNGLSLPFHVLNGNVGYINVIDALLGWQLVREARKILELPAAASYKHTSPAGVGLGIPLDAREELAFDSPGCISPVAAAFVRARNCDPLSSFGDFLAISDIVDETTADLIRREVSDGIIAPGYTSKALEILGKKKGGAFVVLEANLEYSNPSPVEYREIFGVALRQEPNYLTITSAELQDVRTRYKDLPEDIVRDLILANITCKYTQSNSIAIAKGGQVIGIGAGQQNRVDCVRIAGKKARIWEARLSDQGLKRLNELKDAGIKRQERINKLYEEFTMRNQAPPEFPSREALPAEVRDFYEISSKARNSSLTGSSLCEEPENFDWDKAEKEAQEFKARCLRMTNKTNGTSLASDAFFPFPDSIDIAHEVGVQFIIQPGGSTRDEQIISKADEYGMTMCFTGRRLFLH